MYTKIVLKIVYTQIHGKFNIVPFHEKGQLQASLTAFSRKSYSTPFLNIFKRTLFFVTTNQVFNLLIHLSPNSSPFFVRFKHNLTVTLLKLYKEFFLIQLKLLTEYGIKSSSIKCNVLVKQLNFSSYYKAISS